MFLPHDPLGRVGRAAWSRNLSKGREGGRDEESSSLKSRTVLLTLTHTPNFKHILNR